MIRALALVMLLAGCSGGPLSLLTGGGPNVAANVQAGAENNQSIGVTSNTDQTLVRPVARIIEQSSGETGVRSDQIETVIVEGAIPAWLIWAFAAALLLDSPLRWPGQIAEGFGRRKG